MPVLSLKIEKFRQFFPALVTGHNAAESRGQLSQIAIVVNPPVRIVIGKEVANSVNGNSEREGKRRYLSGREIQPANAAIHLNDAEYQWSRKKERRLITPTNR